VKKIKAVFYILFTALLLMSCRDGLQMNQPVGNYLQLDLKLPDAGGSKAANRAIHSDATVLVVSLTYPGKEPIVTEFPFDSKSGLSVFVDKLAPANGVVLDVSLGLTADLPLTQSSTTIDIKVGGNSANLTLAYNTYTIQGTLFDSDGSTLLKGQVIDVDGKTLTSDDNGNFSFDVSTENWSSEYAVFYTDVSGEKYEFARTKKSLIENRSSFKLTAKPELFVDMQIESDAYPLKGGYVLVNDGEVDKLVPVFADSSGRVKYGPVAWTGLNQPEKVRVGFNGVFVESQFNTKGAPGAVIGSVSLQPSVIFSTYDGALNQGESLFRLDYDSTSNKYENGAVYNNSSFSMLDGLPVSIESIVSSGDSSFTSLVGSKVFCNYKTGQIYIWASYMNSSQSNVYGLFKMNGWNVDPNGNISDPLWTMGNVTFKSIPSDLFDSNLTYQYRYSVQQMFMPPEGSKILATTSNGAFTFDPDTLDIDKVWSTGSLSSSILTLTGGYEDSNGNLIASGAVSSTDSDVYINLWNLGSGSYTSRGSILGTSNRYDLSTTDNGGTNTNGGYSINSNSFGTLLGIYPWKGSVMTVLTKNNFYTTSGPVLYAMSWNSSGTSLSSYNSVSDVVNYEYFVPVGVLPNNKFYLVNDRQYGGKDVLRMDDPNDSTLSIKAFLTNGSGSYMYYYFENPFTAY